MNSFSLPTLFYVLTRYTPLIIQALLFAIGLLPTNAVSRAFSEPQSELILLLVNTVRLSDPNYLTDTEREKKIM